MFSLNPGGFGCPRLENRITECKRREYFQKFPRILCCSLRIFLVALRRVQTFWILAGRITINTNLPSYIWLSSSWACTLVRRFIVFPFVIVLSLSVFRFAQAKPSILNISWYLRQTRASSAVLRPRWTRLGSGVAGVWLCTFGTRLKMCID